MITDNPSAKLHNENTLLFTASHLHIQQQVNRHMYICTITVRAGEASMQQYLSHLSSCASLFFPFHFLSVFFFPLSTELFSSYLAKKCDDTVLIFHKCVTRKHTHSISYCVMCALLPLFYFCQS